MTALYLYWGLSYFYFVKRERLSTSFPWKWIFITGIFITSINLQRKIEKKFHVNFGLRQFSHMQSSIRASSLHVRCLHVEFASSANQVRYHTQNRYSLTLDVGSGLTYHERDDIHENTVAYIITYSAKFPRLSVLIKKPLLKKKKLPNERKCLLFVQEW